MEWFVLETSWIIHGQGMLQELLSQVEIGWKNYGFSLDLLPPSCSSHGLNRPKRSFLEIKKKKKNYNKILQINLCN